MEHTGSCYCGRVRFRARGAPMFNILCHCRPCSQARGQSPVHLYGVPEDNFTITKGAEFVKEVECPAEKLATALDQPRPMTHCFCAECGSFVYQRPKGAKFHALSPSTFHIETPVHDDPANVCGISSRLPDHLLPTAHINYENRVRDHFDDLPKFQTFTRRKVRLTNTGELLGHDEAAGAPAPGRGRIGWPEVYLAAAVAVGLIFGLRARP